MVSILESKAQLAWPLLIQQMNEYACCHSQKCIQKLVNHLALDGTHREPGQRQLRVQYHCSQMNQPFIALCKIPVRNTVIHYLQLKKREPKGVNQRSVSAQQYQSSLYPRKRMTSEADEGSKDKRQRLDSTTGTESKYNTPTWGLKTTIPGSRNCKCQYNTGEKRADTVLDTQLTYFLGQLILHNVIFNGRKGLAFKQLLFPHYTTLLTISVLCLIKLVRRWRSVLIRYQTHD